MMMPSPKTLKVVPTSTVDRPVTVTAEVEMKSAVNSEIGSVTETGNHSSRPPARIDTR